MQTRHLRLVSPLSEATTPRRPVAAFSEVAVLVRSACTRRAVPLTILDVLQPGAAPRRCRPG